MRAAAANLSAKAAKVREFLAKNDDRNGTQGKPVKSTITDNQSAKMPSRHGVIQGYNGNAPVDEVIESVDKRQASSHRNPMDHSPVQQARR